MASYVYLVLMTVAAATRVYHVAVDAPLDDSSGSFYSAINARALFEMSAARANEGVLAAAGASMHLDFYDNHEGAGGAQSFGIATDIANVCGALPYEFLAVIGPDYSSDAEPTAQYLSTFNLLMVSWEATADALSDKSVYPNFVRVTITNSYESQVLANLVAVYGWTRVGILASNDDYGNALTQSFSGYCAALGITVVASQPFEADDPSTITSALAVLQAADARIIVVFADLVAGVFEEAERKGMTGAAYQYLTTDGAIPGIGFPLGTLATNIWVNGSLPSVQAFERRARLLPNVTWPPGFAFSEYQPHQDDATQLVAHVLAAFATLQDGCERNDPGLFCHLLTNVTSCVHAPAGGQQAADNATVLCVALAEACAGGSNASLCDPALAAQRGWVTALAFQVPFVSTTGLVEIDADGNRAAPCAIMNQQQFVGYAAPQNATSLPQVGASNTALQFVWQASIVWPGHAAGPPLDRPGVPSGATLSLAFDGLLLLGAGCAAMAVGVVAVLLHENASWAASVRTSEGAGGSRTEALAWGAATVGAVSIALWVALAIGVTALSFSDLPPGVTFRYAPTFLVTVLLVLPLPVASALLLAGTKRDRTMPASEVYSLAPRLSRWQVVVALHRMRGLAGALVLAGGVAAAAQSALAALVWPGTSRATSSLQVVAVLAAAMFAWPFLEVLTHARGPLRFLAPPLLAASVLAAQLVSLAGTTFIFWQGAEDGAHGAQAGAGEALTLQLTGAAVAAVASFVLVVASVLRLRLSRDAIETYAARTLGQLRQTELQRERLRAAYDHVRAEARLMTSMGPAFDEHHPLMATVIAAVDASPLVGGAADLDADGGAAGEHRKPLLEPGRSLGERAAHQVVARPRVGAFVRSSLAMALLKQRMTEGHAAENVLFLADLYAFERRNRGDPALLEYLVRTYLAQDAPQQLNVGALRTRALQVHARDPARIPWDDLRAETERLVRTNALDVGSTATLCAYLVQWSRLAAAAASTALSSTLHEHDLESRAPASMLSAAAAAAPGPVSASRPSLPSQFSVPDLSEAARASPDVPGSRVPVASPSSPSPVVAAWSLTVKPASGP